MSFPTSPVDGELYTNALGTVYQYVLADTAWKIVGSGASGFVFGSGTATYIPIWTDGTTIGDSIMTSDGTTVEISGSVVANGAGTTNYVPIYTDGATAVLGASNLQQVSNGMTLNTPPGGETYLSLGNGFEKIWLTRKGATDSFAVGLSAYGADALVVDQTTGNAHLLEKLGVGPTLKTNAKINTYQDAGADIALNLYRSGLAHGCTDVAPTDAFAQFKVMNTDASYGGLTVQGLNKDAVANGGSGGLTLQGLSTALGNSTNAIVVDGALISGTGTGSIDPTHGVLQVTNNASFMFRVLGNGDCTNKNNIRTGNSYYSSDGYNGISLDVGSGTDTNTHGVKDTNFKCLVFPDDGGGNHYEMQIKNGLVTYVDYIAAP